MYGLVFLIFLRFWSVAMNHVQWFVDYLFITMQKACDFFKKFSPIEMYDLFPFFTNIDSYSNILVVNQHPL